MLLTKGLSQARAATATQSSCRSVSYTSRGPSVVADVLDSRLTREHLES